MGLSGVDLFENVKVSFILQAHNGGAGVPDHYLLERQDILDVPQCAFVSEHTLKNTEGVLIQHPDDSLDAAGIGKHPQPVIAGEQVPVELVLAQEPGVYYTQSAAIVEPEGRLTLG